MMNAMTGSEIIFVPNLQRDVRDLANLRELEPFVRAQKLLAALTGQQLNVSELARQAGINHATAKRFISYLEIDCFRS